MTERPAQWSWIGGSEENPSVLLRDGTVAAIIYKPFGDALARQIADLLNAPEAQAVIDTSVALRHAVKVHSWREYRDAHTAWREATDAYLASTGPEAPTDD